MKSVGRFCSILEQDFDSWPTVFRPEPVADNNFPCPFYSRQKLVFNRGRNQQAKGTGIDRKEDQAASGDFVSPVVGAVSSMASLTMATICKWPAIQPAQHDSFAMSFVKVSAASLSASTIVRYGKS